MIKRTALALSLLAPRRHLRGFAPDRFVLSNEVKGTFALSLGPALLYGAVVGGSFKF